MLYCTTMNERFSRILELLWIHYLGALPMSDGPFGHTEQFVELRLCPSCLPPCGYQSLFEGRRATSSLPGTTWGVEMSCLDVT